jgi:hypothetical protein
MDLENISLSDVSQAQKAKSQCFPFYGDYRTKTNAVMLWDTGHIKWWLHIGEMGQGKGNKNLNVIDMLYSIKTNIATNGSNTRNLSV